MLRFLSGSPGPLALSALLLSGGLGAQTLPGLTADLEWRNIGPANMAARVTDIEAVEGDFARVIVASASGGLWLSDNAGTTWEPIFQDYGTGNMGDLAIFQPDPDIIWVGTGESCTRNSIGWGDGVYKSTDGGKTFRNMGLADTHHISEVLVHPTDPDMVYVASQGHLWGHSGQKGIFKTEDGGESWTELTNGLPAGDTGKIGLAIYRQNPEIVMAIVEHGFQPDRGDEAYEDMTRLGTGIYRSEDGGASWSYLNRYNNRPFYYSHIYIDPTDEQRVYVLAGSAQISEDGGRTFDRSLQGISGDFHALWINPDNSEEFYVGNDKGSYVTFDRGHHFIMFDNMDIGEFYAVTVDNRDPYWVYGGLQDNGNWGGPSNSRDWNGVLNDHWFKFHSGDGFHTTADPDDWRTVYTESQGGNIRRLDAVFRQQGKSITPTPETIINFDEVMPDYEGGPGRLSRDRFRFNWSAPLRLSPHDSRTLLFGGNYFFRSTDRGDTWRIISPDLSTADPELTDPESGGLTRDVTGAETHATILTLAESPVTPGILWAGTDDGRVHVSRDNGGTWVDVGVNLPEPPRGLWVSRVEPSHFHEGTAYVSMDGHRSDEFSPWIFKTTDYGGSWIRISGGIPDGNPIYVLREDPVNPSLLYAGSEFGAFVSVDAGSSWDELGEGLPTVAVHDLVIHPRESDVIAGTHGRSVWILDDVSALQQLSPEVRAAPLHLFEPKVATRWQGISRGATRGHKLFMGRNPLTIDQQDPGNSPRELQNSAAIHFWLASKPSGPVTVEIASLDGELRATHDVQAHAGVNRWFWDLSFDPTEEEREAYRERMAELEARYGGPLPSRFTRGGPRGAEAEAGSYRVRITADGRTVKGTLALRDDPGVVDVLPSVR